MSTLEFNALLVSNRTFLKGFALGFTRDSQDAEDLIQDTMVKALRYKNNFKEGTNIKGWLYTIMRNIFINNYKRKKFQNTILDTTENQYYLNSGSMHFDTVTSRINEKDIHGAIDELKPEFRVPFKMFLDGFHYDEIAGELDIPMGTVKSRIFHARRKLSAELAAFR
ncbi:MAG: sigma-70 family RNA polymerase sigma factor [Bacteroidetes bacterium]|nr:sigma-70 family RNA polymerase sigma factor [Bacteroidota bacterium]MDA1336261.1 sigma-70 family RNA polymerase sigma factor [Bacteroidota bacterium]